MSNPIPGADPANERIEDSKFAPSRSDAMQKALRRHIEKSGKIRDQKIKYKKGKVGVGNRSNASYDDKDGQIIFN